MGSSLEGRGCAAEGGTVTEDLIPWRFKCIIRRRTMLEMAQVALATRTEEMVAMQ